MAKRIRITEQDIAAHAAHNAQADAAAGRAPASPPWDEAAPAAPAPQQSDCAVLQARIELLLKGRRERDDCIAALRAEIAALRAELAAAPCGNARTYTKRPPTAAELARLDAMARAKAAAMASGKIVAIK